MFRLIFIAIILAVVIMVGLAVVSVALSVMVIANSAGGDNMPGPLQKISYAALVILLIGLSLGWLGGI